jgi:hypothetical protein
LKGVADSDTGEGGTTTEGTDFTDPSRVRFRPIRDFIFHRLTPESGSDARIVTQFLHRRDACPSDTERRMSFR